MSMRRFMEAVSVDKNTAPPTKELDDDEFYDARDKTGFFGSQAAGCILMAKTTGRILLVLRSAMVDQPFDWGNVGGAHKSSERPVDAAKREAYEETGYNGNIAMVPLMVFTNGDFRYSNFLAIVDDEFIPELGWEADDHKWCDFGDWPQPLHFGMQSLFNDAASSKAIKHYRDMFANDAVTEDVDLHRAIQTGNNIAAAINAMGDDGEADDAPSSTTAPPAALTPTEKEDAKIDDVVDGKANAQPAKKSMSAIQPKGSK